MRIVDWSSVWYSAYLKTKPVNIVYRLHWGDESPAPRPEVRVVATRVGETRIGTQVDGRRHFAVDYEGLGLSSRIDALRVQLSASSGTVSPARIDLYPTDRKSTRLNSSH